MAKRARLKKDPNQDRIPINDFEKAADLFQWMFYLDWFSSNVQRMVHARSLADSLQDMRTACCTKEAKAEEVRLAFQLFYDVAGPFLTGQFLVSGAWKYFCPDPRCRTDSGTQLTLWRGDGKSVVARVQYKMDEPCDIAFVIE